MPHDLRAWLALIAFQCLTAGPAAWAAWPPRASATRTEAALLGLVLGPAQFILICLGLFLAGLPTTLPAMSLALPLHGAACWIWGRRLRLLPPIPRPVMATSRLVKFAAFVLLGVVALTFTAMTRPASDALLHWVSRGWTFAVEGSAALFPYSYHASYPLAIPVGHLFFLLVDSSIGAASWQRLYALAVLAYSAQFLARRHGRAGLLAAILFLPSQILVFEYVAVGLGLMADATLAASLLLACLFLIEAAEGDAARRWPAALSLSFAAMLKSNSAYLLPLLAVSYGAAALLPPRDAAWPRRRLMRLWLSLAPAVAILAAWRVYLKWRGIADDLLDIANRGMAGELLVSSAPLAAYLHKVRYAFDYFIDWAFLRESTLPQIFSKMGWAIPLTAAGLLSWRRLPAAERFVGLFGFSIWVSLILIIFALTGNADDANNYWGFAIGFSRALSHAIPLLALAIQLRLAREAEGWNPRLDSLAAGMRGWRAAVGFAGAVALLGLASLAILRAHGASNAAGSAPYDFTRKMFPVDLDAYAPDPYGFYQYENWGEDRVRWIAGDAEVDIQRQGDRLKFKYHVGHPDISTSNPVEVVFTVNGVASVSRRHEAAGYFKTDFALSPDSGAYVQLKIQVSRTFSPPNDPRKLGIAIFKWKWK